MLNPSIIRAKYSVSYLDIDDCIYLYSCRQLYQSVELSTATQIHLSLAQLLYPLINRFVNPNINPSLNIFIYESRK